MAMDDMTLGLWITLITTVLALVLPFSIMRVVLRGLGLSSKFTPGSLLLRWFPGLRWWWVLGISLFGGLMIATAGGAVYPKVIQPGAQWLCRQGQVRIDSQAYSYKPGQQGVSRRVVCEEPGDNERDITFSSIAAAFVMYSLVIFVLMALWQLLRGARGEASAQDFSQPPDAAPFLGAEGVGPKPPGGAPKVHTTVNVHGRQIDGLDALGDVVRQQLGAGMAGLVEQALRDGQFSARTRKTVVVNDRVIDTADGGSEPAERLRQLSGLLDQGLITEAEYHAKRAEVLKRL